MQDFSDKWVPTNRVIKWIEDRLPILGLIYSSFIAFRVPRNINYWWTFGAVLLVMLVIQIITGLFLAMGYVPGTATAFDSVVHIDRNVNYGELIRSMHANGASFFFIAAYFHILRGMYYGSYKAPREILWIVGVIMYFIMMGTAFLGYSIVWGQMSAAAATVITSVFKAVPLVGETLYEYAMGGYAVGNPTVIRFYALHFLLPFILVGFTIIHVWALHVVANNNPAGVEIRTRRDTLPFWPYMILKDLVMVGIVLFIYAFVVFFLPRALGHAINYIPADLTVSPDHIAPEWYFGPFFTILRAIDNTMVGIIAMFGAVGILVFMPWLDRSPVKSARYRPVYRFFFLTWVFSALVLGWLATKSTDGSGVFAWIAHIVSGSPVDEGCYKLLAQLATAWYFAFFFPILPIVSLLEKPKPVPASIAEDAVAHLPKVKTPPQAPIVQSQQD
ncbi:MAG: cytochrome b N-terminal domain-containing protein [Methylobacteriaceae bacterium]|jgi:ubiquinol-cytochrome c reductase cytochrome b subunit|nr:cytochrome b N-terminal domain-containing protein [Methylobacteriaceae bacterium]